MNVKYHVFKDYKLNVASQTDEEKLSQMSEREVAKAREMLYSFVSMSYDPKRKSLFLGATHRLGDILVEFDIKSGTFNSCGYGKTDFCGPYDVKIHKGLALDPDGEALYFGIATLNPLSELIGVPGGAVVRYDIPARKFTCLSRPLSGDFIQGTCFDFQRGNAYLFTDRDNFGVFNLHQKKLLRTETMQSTPHNGCIDDDGGVWGTHSPGVQGFYRYDPDKNSFRFPSTVLPNARAAANVMYPGAGPVDSFVNGRDGYLYVGTALGEFYRLDPRSGALKYLGKPFPDTRLPGLAIGQDGWLYLCGGNSRASMLGRYNREENRFEHLGTVEHPDGTFLHYAHEIVVVDGVVYIGETDNLSRSGYLWECVL